MSERELDEGLDWIDERFHLVRCVRALQASTMNACMCAFVCSGAGMRGEQWAAALTTASTW